jgi:alkanesulfonate monooxygenase SsuD/methylene tetrahydromethanopterin reductase-like flavin-dependent oxidoreductase (luciferase family)
LAAPSQYLHCVPVLARLASEVSSVKLCTNIIQLTLHHPVQIAEELATLDVITGGRLVVGFGRGYREDEFLAFGVGPGARLGRFLEAWEIVRRLWAEDSVTFDGKHFQLADASIGIRPVQPNGPPLVLAASGDKMIARAAKMADGWSAVGHSTLDILARQSDLYKQALADAGRAFPPQHYRVAVETYVAPTRAEAERKAFPHVARKYAGYASWGQDKELPDGQTFDLPIEELRAERFNIGDPVQVTERFLEYHAAMGMSELGVRLFWAGMPHADLLAAIELMGERVMPDVLKAIG